MTTPHEAPMSPEERARAVVAEREAVFGRPGYVSTLDAITSALRSYGEQVREECARVAEAERERWNENDRIGLAYWSTADRIARAIRHPSAASGGER